MPLKNYRYSVFSANFIALKICLPIKKKATAWSFNKYTAPTHGRGCDHCEAPKVPLPPAAVPAVPEAAGAAALPVLPHIYCENNYC